MQARLIAIALFCVLGLISQPARSEDTYTAAARHYAAGDYAAAAKAFGAILEHQPNHPRALEARFYLAEASLQLEDLDAARQQYAEFLKAAPNHPLARHALLHQGEASLMSGKAAEARPVFEQFLRAYPKDEAATTAQVRLGQTLEALGDLSPALKLYNALATNGGEHAWAARLGAGRVLYRLGRHAEAARILTTAPLPEEAEVASEATYWTALAWMAQQRPREAVELIDRTLEKYPRLAGADMLEYSAGLAWQQAGDRAAAAERYERLARSYPESPWSQIALKYRVQLAFETNDYEQAAALADGFLAKYPESVHRPTVLQYRGRIATRMRQFQLAETTFRELIADASKTADSAHKPAPTSHWLYLAESQIGRGAYGDGLKSLAEAEQLGVPSGLAAEATALKANGLVGLRRSEEAITLLTSWLQTHGKRSDAGVCRARLAYSQAAAGKWQAALAGLNQWYQTHPDEPQSLLTMYGIGELAYRQGNFPVALNCFERLSSEDVPEVYRADGLAGAAITRFAMGNHVQSATTWAQLLKEYPSYPLAAEASFQYAKALEHVGNVPKALAAYRQVAKMYPQTEEAPHALTAAARLAAEHADAAHAIELYQELAERYPENPQRDSALAAWATLLDRNGDAEAADSVWLRLEQEYPKSRLAQQGLRRSAQAAVKRNSPEAAALVARLQESNDDATRCHATYLAGKLAASAGEWDKVETLMQQVADGGAATELQLEAAYWLAEAAFQQKNWETAKERFELLDADGAPRNDAWLARVPLRRAQILIQEKEWGDALELATQTPERFPQTAESADLKLILAQCYAGLDRFEEAQQILTPLAGETAENPTESQVAARRLLREVTLALRQRAGEEDRTATEGERTLR